MGRQIDRQTGRQTYKWIQILHRVTYSSKPLPKKDLTKAYYHERLRKVECNITSIELMLTTS